MSIVMFVFVSASKPFGSNDNPPVILLEVMISSVEKELICIFSFAYVFYIREPPKITQRVLSKYRQPIDLREY